MNPKIILLLLSLLIEIYLFIYLFSRKDNTQRRLYSTIYVILIASSLWIITNALFYIFEPANLYFIAILSYISALFSLYGVLCFSILFNKKKLSFHDKVTLQLFGLSTVVISILVSIPKLVLERVDQTSEGFTLVTTPLIAVYGVYLLLLFVSITFISLIKFTKLKKVNRKRFQVFLIASIISMAWGITFNFLLPVLGNYNLTWLGPVCMSFWVLSMIYSIVRYRLFDIGLAISNALETLLYSIFTYTAYIAAYFYHQYFLQGEFTLEGILIGISLSIVFTILYKVYGKIVLRVIQNYIITSETSRYEIHSNFTNTISSVLEVNKILDIYTKYIKQALDSKGVLVLLYDKTKHKQYMTKGFSNQEKPFIDNLIKLSEILSVSKVGRVNSLAEIQEKGFLEKSQVLNIDEVHKKFGWDIVIDLESSAEINGVIIIKAKYSAIPYTNSEFKFLETLTSSLLITLSRAYLYEEVKNFNQTLKTEVKEATKELSQKYDELQEIRNKERDMMDIMGHELRTPLSIIKMTLAILKVRSKSKKFNGEMYQEYHNRLSDALIREVQLLEAMISSTKIDANRMNLHLTKVDLTKLVNDALYAQKSFIQEKALKINFKPVDEHQYVYADKTRMGEVLDNLIGNAVKYTNEGSITIYTEIPASNVLQINIQDTGIGIPKEAQKRLGEKFFRVSTYLDNKLSNDVNVVRPGGTGLGLYVSFGLIKIMGGTISIASEVGKGSTFSFTIPLYTGQKDVDQVQKEKNVFERLKIKQQLSSDKLTA